MAGNVVESRDIGMIQSRRRAGFPQEAAFQRQIRRQLRRQNLDRNGSSQPCVQRPVYLAHSTCPKQVFYLVWPESPTSYDDGLGLQQTRGALPRRAIQQRSLLRQHQFHFAPHLWVGLIEQGGTFLRPACQGCVVQPLNQLEALGVQVCRRAASIPSRARLLPASNRA